MKTYSDDIVTKNDLKEIDATQTEDIANLRWLIVGSFVINLIISGAIWFLK
jgi:hypothetical protein